MHQTGAYREFVRTPVRWMPMPKQKFNQSATFKETIMGKYFLAWLLGVPLFVLVLIYLIF